MRPSIKAQWRASINNELAFPRNIDTDHLKVGGRYSPFGILCELYIRSGLTDDTWEGFVASIQSFKGEAKDLPIHVQDWARMAMEEVEDLKGKNHSEVYRWLSRQQQTDEMTVEQMMFPVKRRQRRTLPL